MFCVKFLHAVNHLSVKRGEKMLTVLHDWLAYMINPKHIQKIHLIRSVAPEISAALHFCKAHGDWNCCLLSLDPYCPLNCCRKKLNNFDQN